MSARNVLLLIIMTFFFTALLLIYNGFYKLLSLAGVELPPVTDQGR